MSPANRADQHVHHRRSVIPTTRSVVADSLGEKAGVWPFVFETLLTFYPTGWLAMRFALPQPSTLSVTPWRWKICAAR